MQLAIVRGTVVSTYKEPSLRGTKFLLLQLVDLNGQPLPEYEVAADTVGAGVEEWVLFSRGSAARQVRDASSLPIDAAVVAIVDTVNLANLMVYSKSLDDLRVDSQAKSSQSSLQADRPKSQGKSLSGS
jgi:carbon dioxide concentrating mechanism protein CcmL